MTRRLAIVAAAAFALTATGRCARARAGRTASSTATAACSTSASRSAARRRGSRTASRPGRAGHRHGRRRGRRGHVRLVRQDADGNVWYLGEDTAEFEHGKVSSREGSFETGVDGAEAGVIMPAEPEAGLKYRQEYYAGEAEDTARC